MKGVIIRAARITDPPKTPVILETVDLEFSFMVLLSVKQSMRGASSRTNKVLQARTS